MKKFLSLVALLAAVLPAPGVIITVSPWTPIFKGIDLADGRQQAELAGEIEQRVLCYRIDLQDPDVQLFTTPKCTNCGVYETVAQNTSLFLEQYGVQVAVNGGFYASSSGPNDVPIGTPEDVFGLAISGGTLVSPANDNSYMAAMLFTTNKQAFFIPANASPGTNTAGIYTAVSGSRVLLLNGVNQQVPTPTDRDPRTGIGLSQDRRYLFLMTIDGRNPQNGSGWSNGADFYDTGEWLRRFGAWDGANLDGGGSTTMAMADCTGKSVRLNRSSFVLQYGRERNIGNNFGVYAPPLPSPILNLNVQPGTTTALVTWETANPATTQVEYGLTTNYGSVTPIDNRLVRFHTATLTGLISGSNYYFRAVSVDGGDTLAKACSVLTTGASVRSLVFDVAKAWKYTTNNLDGINWTAPAYNDSAWVGPSNACFHIEPSTTTPPGYSLPPRTTLLPPGYVVPIFRTYYFRTPFTYNGSVAGATLTFSNFIDDGAVFYLNGAELQRIRVPALPNVITFATFATSGPCSGLNDAYTSCPDVFTVAGNALVQGTNIVAVELHNVSGGTTSQDVLFGSALFVNSLSTVLPRLYVHSENGQATLYWNGQGFTLQRSTDLSNPAAWTDVPGPVTQSPAVVTQQGTVFYRLRN